MKKIALITSGGDAPGMNACVRGIVKSCIIKGITPIGFFDGYQGMIENKYTELKSEDVANIIQRGGTILGTARSEEFKSVKGRKKAIENLKNLEVDGFICIGGDGSFAGALTLYQEMKIPIIGIPATIDNDVFGTEKTIGFDTALNTVVEAVDKIKDTAGSHHRIFLVEVMGRDAGHIALNSAIASGAASVLIPEERSNIKLLAEDIKSQNKRHGNCIVIVAEGDDEGGVKEIEEKLTPLLPQHSLRTTVLGHIQRGGKPSATDRILATRLGVSAVTALIEGRNGIMLGINGEKITATQLQDAIEKKSLPELDKLEVIKNTKTVR